MSSEELRRVEVLARVRSKQLQIVGASKLLHVSCRQAKRLWKRYRDRGAAGLKHRSAGRPSNHTHERKFRNQVLKRVREKYSGPVGERFDPALAAEHLDSEDGLPVNAETLRQSMLAEGLWSRARKRRQHRRTEAETADAETEVGTFGRSPVAKSGSPSGQTESARSTSGRTVRSENGGMYGSIEL